MFRKFVLCVLKVVWTCSHDCIYKKYIVTNQAWLTIPKYRTTQSNTLLLQMYTTLHTDMQNISHNIQIKILIKTKIFHEIKLL